MRYVTNKKTGEIYCLHCRSYECICLPEDITNFIPDSKRCTELEVKQIIDMPSRKSVKFIFYKQKISNGVVIKSNSELIVPMFKWYKGPYKTRQTILLCNAIINKSFKA